MPMNFKKLGRGRVQRDVPSGTNIYEGLVTRNLTEATYTTSTDGRSIALNPSARERIGANPVAGGTVDVAARQPKGMLLRTGTGTQQVHTGKGL